MENIIKNINILELKNKFEQKTNGLTSENFLEKIKSFDLKKIETYLKSSDRPVVFVHSDTDLSRVVEKSNLILSPAYYWCKKEDLEIESIRKARKLTRSIFFGQLPDGDFHYKATKIDNEFFFFAYDKEKILEDLLAQGMKKELIGNVYFAQNECRSDRVCKISDRFALIHQNTMVSIMPLKYASDPKDFETLDIDLSNTYFKYRNPVDSSDKNLLVSTVFVAIWIVLEIINGYRLGSDLGVLESQRSELIEKYKLPATSFQRKAIEDKYEGIEKSQNRIREIFTDITSFPTTKDNYFKEISLEKKEIKAVFSYTTKDTLEDLKKRLKGATFSQTDSELLISYKL